MSEALQALYAGEVEKARELLPADDELSVFDAAAFGRVERLRAILARIPPRPAPAPMTASPRSTSPSSAARRRRPGS